MNSNIIFHSYSGKTKNVVEQVQRAIGGDITEVSPRKPYTSLSVVPAGCYRALRGVSDPVIPETIDVSESEIIVVASPVWAGRPSPVINGAISTLTGCQGKKAFIIVTCNNEKSGQQALIPFSKNLEERGLTIAGTAVIDRHHLDDTTSISDLIENIRSAGGA